MRVKRYVADSMTDALQRIRTELGKDAVILNTKEVRTGGFLGLFGKKQIEVIAAIDNSLPPQQRAADVPEPARAASETGIATAPKVRAETAVYSPPQAVDTQVRLSGVTGPRYEEGPQPLPRPLPQMGMARHGTQEALFEEIRQVKEMVQIISEHSGASLMPEAFRSLERRLLEQDIDPQIVSTLIARARAGRESRREWSKSEAKAAVREVLLETMRAGGHRPLEHGTRIAHFVGPTGVGKTTTIAKLAAEQALKYNRKVGFITSDTYRIAAVEQLKTYANILNVPLEVVFSPQELLKAFKRLEDRDIIFMDTAGRNFRNELYVSELNALLQSSGNGETYLVLSLTSKYRDMKAIVENFMKFKLDKVLYTKMDETETFGPIVNIAWHYALKGSYITNGQNVPDDIAVMNVERIVDLILGGDDGDA